MESAPGDAQDGDHNTSLFVSQPNGPQSPMVDIKPEPGLEADARDEQVQRDAQGKFSSFNCSSPGCYGSLIAL